MNGSFSIHDPTLRPGAKISVTLTTDEHIDGFVHSKDHVMGVLLVRVPKADTPDASLSCEVRMIMVAAIKTVQIDLENSEKEMEVRVPSFKALEKREMTMILRNEEAMAELNDAASPHGQMVFDALNATMPCRWVGMDIVVLDQVLIKPDYTTANCTSLNGDEAAFDRLVKVLQGVTTRMTKKIKDAAQTKTPAATDS